MRKFVEIGMVLSVFGTAACGHAGLSERTRATVAVPRLSGKMAGVVVQEYAVKPLVPNRLGMRHAVFGRGRPAIFSRVAVASSSAAFSGRDGDGRALRGSRLSNEHGPYSTEKKGAFFLLNKALLIKSGAMANTKALNVGKRPRGTLSQLNQTMLIKSGAMANTKALNVGKRPRGTLSQLNQTMLIKSGAMARTDAIRVHRHVQIHVPAVAQHRAFHVQRLSRVPAARARSPLGGRCFGTSCDD